MFDADEVFFPPIAVCRATCANGGTCTAPSECTCAEGWSGNTCQQGLVKVSCNE